MELMDAALSGDRLKTLYAMRELIARALDETESAREIGTLTLRLDQVMLAIGELEPKQHSGTALDELNRRRAARRDASTDGRSHG